MPQTVTIKSLPVAFEMLKAMQAEGVEWGEDYRAGSRHALAELLEGRMGETIDRHLERMAERGEADRRTGACPRWLLAELSMIERDVPQAGGLGMAPLEDVDRGRRALRPGASVPGPAHGHLRYARSCRHRGRGSAHRPDEPSHVFPGSKTRPMEIFKSLSNAVRCRCGLTRLGRKETSCKNK
jgi:hypothetical protein